MTDVWTEMGALFAYARMLAQERENMGFVWTGDMEKDPRFMDDDLHCSQPGRVIWARDKDDELYVLQDAEWRKVDDAWWTENFPHAPLPQHLPRSSS